ncbi:leucoanthocyanidin reductase-like [Vicia villosa]|uniref:leucoanthocyanidin reductase-like n=1 Tax=Vicia villosa TaxID=3911 RepID=UPI00273C826F|nr:leucoanthocyanidin reductase-like [Vicia villosa]
MALSSPPTTLAPKSRVLIIGATGFMGKFLTEASLSSAHPTYLLIRPEGTLISSKSSTIKTFQEKGAIIIYGGVSNKEFMEKILKKYEIDIVISAIGADSLLDQITLVEAMKTIKTIKRFLPSEFGHDVDRAEPVEPGLAMYKQKRLVRRALEESGVPYTYVCCNSIASWPYYNNCHPSSLPPPLDQLHVYGNGNIKAYFVDGIDIGKFTMKIVDDDRAINKNIHFRPSINCYSMNELASLWENKIARKIPRLVVSENDLLAIAAENIIPESIVASLTHDIFINGCQVSYKIDGINDVEISTLYPGESFRSMEECFESFVVMAADEIHKGENGVAGATKSIVEPVIITASC